MQHPKFRALVRMLKMPRAHVRGHMELMWEAGHALGSPILGLDADVEEAAEWEGIETAWAQACVAVGFLERLDDGRLAIHDFEDHAPGYAVKWMQRCNGANVATVACAFCGKSFVTANERKRFCSERCRNASFRAQHRIGFDHTSLCNGECNGDATVATVATAIPSLPFPSQIEEEDSLELQIEAPKPLALPSPEEKPGTAKQPPSQEPHPIPPAPPRPLEVTLVGSDGRQQAIVEEVVTETIGDPWDCSGTPSTWTMPLSLYRQFERSYPAIDLPAEFRKAKAWLASNPTKRKTARGMSKFLNGWLGRANDSGKYAKRAAASAAKPMTAEQEADRQYWRSLGQKRRQDQKGQSDG